MAWICRIKSATAGMKSNFCSEPSRSDNIMVAPITDPNPHIIPPIKFLVTIFRQLTCSFALYRSDFISLAYGFLLVSRNTMLENAANIGKMMVRYALQQCVVF